jgi:hypothetical protein
MQEKIITFNGTVKYYFHGHFHREDGPAIEWANGHKEWFLHGKWHREDGPAREYHESKEWWIHGKRHREDGPAREYPGGHKRYYLCNKEYSEEEYWRLVKLKALW